MKLNPNDGAVVAKAVVGDGAAGIAINGSEILVVNNGSNSVSVLGKEGTVVSTLKVGISPYGVAVTPSGIWVTNAGSDSVSRR
jgi:YVTN family beta-propeller protein